MTTKHLIPADVAELYDVHEWRNAVGVLSTACSAEWDDVLHALRAFRLLRSEIVQKGGRKSLKWASPSLPWRSGSDVEEFLSFVSPVQFTKPRFVRRGIELGGAWLRKADRIMRR